MRPISIVNFERCYLGALILSVINSLIVLPAMIRMPQMAQASSMFGGGLIYGSIIVGLLITLALWYFAARKASVVAKWIIVVFFAFGALGMVRNVATGFAAVPAGPSAIVGIVAFVLQAVAVYLLFRPDSSAWFRGENTLSDTFR